MSQSLLFSTGVGVFAMTIVGAMIFGRHAFSQVYDRQVADARSYAVMNASIVVSTLIPEPPRSIP